MDAGQNKSLNGWSPPELIGTSAPMRQVRKSIGTYGPRESTVLIHGESGTGKELIAWAIHRNSSRRGRAFIRVNCSAIPDSLWESEMFGHAPGSFTGAVRRHVGKFEQANGGTLFLDEIGETSLIVQPKLLCALETRVIDILGGTKPVPVDIRIVAATNRDLKREVEEGRFRLDLYYRINVLTIQSPALRDRVEDIPLLARHFALQFGKSGVSEDAAKILSGYHWPGNVRELRNAIERAVADAESDVLEADHVRSKLREIAQRPRNLLEGLGHEKYSAYDEALVLHNFNCQRAARYLQVHPNSMYRHKKKMCSRVGRILRGLNPVAESRESRHLAVDAAAGDEVGEDAAGKDGERAAGRRFHVSGAAEFEHLDAVVADVAAPDFGDAEGGVDGELVE